MDLPHDDRHVKDIFTHRRQFDADTLIDDLIRQAGRQCWEIRERNRRIGFRRDDGVEPIEAALSDDPQGTIDNLLGLIARRARTIHDKGNLPGRSKRPAA